MRTTQALDEYCTKVLKYAYFVKYSVVKFSLNIKFIK